MSPQSLSIGVRRCGQDVVAEVECHRATTDMDWPSADLADRVTAIGGDLQRTETDDRLRLVAILPCE
jgi:hypothetical protein